MKPLLALVALGLTTLFFEEKARQVAGDAQEAYGEFLAQANEAKKALTERVERQPVMSLLVAGGLAYFLASLIPNRS
jgi:Sec-independent protein translocase protein TatA